MREIRHRWSPTIGELEGTAEDVWGTRPYWGIGDKEHPTVFFGVYGLPDFYTLWQHRGKRWILWAGTDITHLLEGYWLDGVGKIRLDSDALAQWIDKNCESWVENAVEKSALSSLGIKSRVAPSYFGKVLDISYEPSERPKVYLSVSNNEFVKYGWYEVETIAKKVNVDFYLYGNTKPWKTTNKNVHVRGRVSKEVMNEEIKTMQCGLRPLSFDGCSEIIVKAGLMGHHVISKVKYPHAMVYGDLGQLVDRLRSLKGKKASENFRNWLLLNMNKFPWVG